ncbi:MAG: hypothetical protein RIC19_24970 [Phaeodactylibacter sp.]|uniref:hypothetical protein n=1 Tax=Phaeodactylibacter sp. TaxID=1940289 RepID=UPI0032EE171E
MDNLSFQYPVWYLLLCLLLGGLFAGVLYYRSTAFRSQGRTLNIALGLLRFVAVSLIAILLLTPLLRHVVREVKNPIILIAQDQSESVGSALAEGKDAYLSRLKALQEELEGDFEVKTYGFGSEVREGLDTAFEDKQSNIAEALSTLYDLYSGQNLGAIVLASDGIYNKGSNPLYANAPLDAPLFTIPLGDTTAKRDLLVKRVFHNRIVYLGDKFSIQVDLAADNAAGSDSRVNIYKIVNGKAQLLQQEPVTINQNSWFETREYILNTDQAGVQRFRISLSEIPEEATTVNNSKDIFIDVLDARQKILVLGNAPHPDLTAFRQALSSNQNYEVTTATIANLEESPAAYDFIILHNLPSRANAATTVLNAIARDKVPHLFVVGNQTDLQQFNQAQRVLSIQKRGNSANQVQAYIKPGFNLFQLSEDLKEQLPGYTPLTAVFGDYDIESSASALLYQRIGKVETNYPLLVLGEGSGTKVGVLGGEGIWRWRLFDYLQNQDHERFDELIGKVVQYLSLKEDKRRFRVSLNKNIFDENEPVYFDAELYNQSFELINEPDASLTVKDASGKEYNFTFNRAGNAYRLNAGILPVGNYQFTGNVFFSGEQFTYDGQFSIQPIQLEQYETTANHNTLRLLSKQYGGAVFYPDAIPEIAAAIRGRDTVKPVIYETAQTQPVLNFKWLFGLLLLLLVAEWGMRRYFGAY